MGSTPKLSISCHCGAAKQVVRVRDQSSGAPQEIDFCHCTACRHNTGLLCVSYAGIERPDSVAGLREYCSTTELISRLFCATCGCHVFRKLRAPLTDEERHQVRDGTRNITEQKELWATSTGVIIGVYGADGKESNDEYGEVLMRYAKHINTAGTKDGGLSPFISGIEGSQGLKPVENQDSPTPSIRLQSERKSFKESDLHVEAEVSSQSDEENGTKTATLKAFCHCGGVKFHITRPNDASRLPRSNLPDLMVPYHSGSPQIQNPENNKWWLRPELNHLPGGADGQLAEEGQRRRYLAGTCACRSCRLTSGFEIQTWAFVPRANIFFHIRGNHAGTASSTVPPVNEPSKATEIVPLDFTTLPPDILTSYESSQGVRREFCPRCGATVFWRDRWRPELIDVSVGLLDAAEGARAESWLDWWTGRVSFAEDAGNGRTGETAKLAHYLINNLEEGLRVWREKETQRDLR